MASAHFSPREEEAFNALLGALEGADLGNAISLLSAVFTAVVAQMPQTHRVVAWYALSQAVMVTLAQHENPQQVVGHA